MSETATKPAPALPLFFHKVVGVNAAQHSQLRLDRTTGFEFAAHAQAVPLGLGELDVACQHFPIVFTTGPQTTPMALLGLKEGVNLFVHPDGSWRPDSYIPAYVRAFPFIFVEDREKSTMFVGMEEGAHALGTSTGAALFEDGKPSPAMNEAIQFCAAFRDNVNAASAFGAALQEAGLLEEEEANVNFTAGGTARVTGFKVIKADRMDKVSDETYLEWRHKGWISHIHAQLFSTARWARLVELSAG